MSGHLGLKTNWICITFQEVVQFKISYQVSALSKDC